MNKSGNVLRLEVTGRMTTKEVTDEYIQDMLVRIASTNCRSVSLDLSRVNFMDSTGVVMVVKMFRYCEELGKHFYVENPVSVVETLLRTVKLDRVIPIVGRKHG